MDSSYALDIMLVAPDPAPFANLVMRLRAANHRIWEMRNCGSALAFLLDNAADVVIVDSSLRGMHGLEIVPLLRKIRPATRVVAVIDESSVDDLRRVLGVGIFFHSIKPVDDDRILEAISQASRTEDSAKKESENG
ncbi:MAG: response regulator [Acidobacteria bacterium]|nr:response regulator [Acidobacteriota bacterium]